MNYLIPTSIILIVTVVIAAPVPVSPKGPSPEATRLIEQRRQRLRDLPVINLGTPVTEEIEAKREGALKDLAAALGSEDPYVLDEAVRDVVNSEYRWFDPEKIVALLVLRMGKSETHPKRMTAQGWLMEVLLRTEYRAFAKPAIPGLLRMIADDKATEYTRKLAVQTAGRIGSDDPTVLKAFSEALGHKEYPTDVLTRLAESAGEMGPLAAHVKPALVKMYERGDTYDDPAYVALGKIAQDAKPGSLEDCLKQLGKINELPPDQVSAAFLNVVRLGMIVDSEDIMKAEVDRIDKVVARATRPVLLKVVREHAHDAHGRAALRALAELGPGGDPEMVKLLTNLIVEYRETLSRMNEIRISLPPGPKLDSVQAEFSRLLDQPLEKHVTAALVKLEPSDPASVKVLTEAFSKMARPRDWHVAAALAVNLAKFGEKARPAIPEAMKAIHTLRWTKERDNTLDACVAYLSILTAGGGPEARKAVIGMLDPAGTVMKDSGPHAAELQGHLLLTLERIGLPVEMEDRAVALRRIEDGLSSDFTLVFSAAAKVVIQLPSPAEAGAFVKPLARVLKEDFKFQKLPGSADALRYRFSSEEQWLISEGLIGKTLTLRALGAIGTGAKEALSAVARIADQPLAPKVGFSPESFGNRLIREAIETRRLIESGK